MSERLLVIGDTLLDRDVEGRSDRLAPDAPVPVVDQGADRPRPGGAGLAAKLAAGSGLEVTLMTALAADEAGGELGRQLLGAGVDVLDLGLTGATAEKIRVLDRGRPLLRLDRGGGGEVRAPASDSVLGATVAAADAILVSDYGYGVAATGSVRAALAGRRPSQPLVWDPHPRGAAPVARTTLATPNLAEASAFARWREEPDDPEAAGRLAEELRGRWGAEAVCVTRGAAGAVLAQAGTGVLSCACEVAEGDPCGAGDRFAAEAATVLAEGGGIEEAILSAVVAAAEFVAAGGARGAAAPEPAAIVGAGEQGVGAAPLSIEPALALAARVRRAGGTVVATGGCFDLLHAGHLGMLKAARQLGDCLIVLLNGDRSVRRLKGPRRPLVGELERAELLKGLACVDEVAIFDEEMPIEALRLLRPDVWAKGGDYSIAELPERRAIGSWGGRVAILPRLAGRSTTKLIEKVGERG